MYIYGFFTTLLFILILPFYYLVRVMQGKSFGWKEKLGFFDSPDLGKKIIMFHGVSVGEIIALENIIKKTKEIFPEYKIVITTGTKTGQDIAHKKYENIADYITYFPFDFPYCVRSFLDKVNPSVILIAETELWPTFAFYSNKKNIPLYIINGRISDSTYKSYRLLTPFFRSVLKNYTGIFTQSEEDKNKLTKIGASPDKTEVMKNLKFDIKKSNEVVDLSQGDNRVIIAGSTHKGEDEIIINTFAGLKKEFNDIKLILAPRHLNRMEHIIDLINKTGLSYGLRSKHADFSDKDIIILDTMGELSKMYSVCDFAFIGGSFNKTGGHNPLEAIVYNKPVISGPSIHNFRDIYWLLTRSNAGKIVKTPEELKEYMKKLLSDNNFYDSTYRDCKAIFNNQQGALDFVINKLSEILK